MGVKMYSIDFIGNITRDSDGATIPYDMGNIHYQEYLDWIAEGNTPLPYEPPIIDPREQARAELAATDPGIARVGEGIIKLLISKGIISESDLPPKAVERMKQRAEWRAALSK